MGPKVMAYLGQYLMSHHGIQDCSQDILSWNPSAVSFQEYNHLFSLSPFLYSLSSFAMPDTIN